VSEYLQKSHNVTVLLYHLVFPAKYRRAVFDNDVDGVLKEVCIEIEKRYRVTRRMCGIEHMAIENTQALGASLRAGRRANYSWQAGAG
jgi:REP element-mobilizing transposase RayT